MTPPLTLADVQAAARIDGRVHRTPVFTSRTSTPARAGGSSRPRTPAMRRLQGPRALNAVSLLGPEEAARGVLTDSSGNHGQAPAWAAAERGPPRPW